MCVALPPLKELDHSKAMKDIAKARLPIYSSKGTLDAIGINGNVMVEGKVSKVGNFKVLPFSIRHDCEEPFGFIINHKDTGNILFATDTYYLPNRFANLSHIMIEANYSQEVIDRNVREGSVSQFLRDRTMQSHMSIDTCIEALLANDLNKVQTIVLLHLSDRNSDEKGFQEQVESATGIQTFVANKGLEIELKKYPF